MGGRQNIRLFVDKDLPSIDLWRLIGTACELALLLPYAGLEWAQRESRIVDDLEAPLLVRHPSYVVPGDWEILPNASFLMVLRLPYTSMVTLLGVG